MPSTPTVPVVTIDDVAIEVSTLTTDDILSLDFDNVSEEDAGKLAQRLTDIEEERKEAQRAAAAKAVATRKARESARNNARAALLARAASKK